MCIYIYKDGTRKYYSNNNLLNCDIIEDESNFIYYNYDLNIYIYGNNFIMINDNSIYIFTTIKSGHQVCCFPINYSYVDNMYTTVGDDIEFRVGHNGFNISPELVLYMRKDI